MTRFAVNQSSGANSPSASSTRVPRLGELLVAANVVKTGVLNESLQIAKTSKTFIGRTLISLGQLDEQKLQAALEIQNLIRSQVLSSHLGIKALSMACIARISAEEALQRLGLHKAEQTYTHESSLAQFMLDAELVSPQILDLADQQSIENNLPLGRCLIVNRYTTQARLEAVLTAQVLIREEQITYEQALKALKISFANREPVEHALLQFGVQQLQESDKRVLEILATAGILSETTKLSALEIALTDERSPFDVLIESETVAEGLIAKAFSLQVQILAGYLTLKHAARLLKKSHYEGHDLDVLINQAKSSAKSANQAEQLTDLLISVGLLSEKQVLAAQEIALNNTQQLGQVLLEQNQIDPGHLESAWQAQRMIDDKLIGSEYARKALRKLTGLDRDNQSMSQDEIQQITQTDIDCVAPENWLTRITKKLFNK